MKKESPFVSIIVPAYNIEAYIAECIESILKQSYEDWELLIVDDGSTDRTGKICEEYARRDDRVRVVHKANGGLVSARKSGLAEAEGEYICYVDGDDWIAQDALEILCESAQKENADIVIADFVYVSGEKRENFSQEMRPGIYTKEDLEKEFYPRMLCTEEYYTFGIQPSLCAKIIRRNILVQNQYAVDDRIRLGEDAACSYACYLTSEKVIYLKDKYLYFYRVRQTSISQAIKRTFYTEEVEILINHLKNQFSRYSEFFPILERQLWMYACHMIDNMLTPHISFGQLFFGKELKDALTYIRNSDMGHEMLQHCGTIRTSSRVKGILKVIAKPTMTTKIELFMFRLYERIKK